MDEEKEEFQWLNLLLDDAIIKDLKEIYKEDFLSLLTKAEEIHRNSILRQHDIVAKENINLTEFFQEMINKRKK